MFFLIFCVCVCFDLGFVVFAVGCVGCRTVRQCFACVLVTCVSNSTWCGVTVKV